MKAGAAEKEEEDAEEEEEAAIAMSYFTECVKMYICMDSNGPNGFGSSRTEPLSNGLTVYWFQKEVMVWIFDKRFGSVLKLGFIGS